MLQSTKGQIRLVESTLILFVFFFMLMIGLVVYMNFQEARLDRVKNEILEQQAIDYAQKVLSIPELECSDNGVKVQDCMELYKLEGMTRDLDSEFDRYARYYFEEFGPTKVSIQLVYAPSFESSGLTAPPLFLDNSQNVDYTKWVTLFDYSEGLKNKQTFYFPISLWDRQVVPAYSYYGWMRIEVYS